jgi:mannose-6-phosphate isomerase-like protein (cupin superfamily)
LEAQMANKFEDPALGHTLSFSLAERKGNPVTRIEMWVKPGGGVPPHVHPSIEETFEVLDGQLQVLGGRHWNDVGPGESAVASPGMRHAYRNRGAVETHAICWAAPPSDLLEGFLSDAAALGRAGRLTRKGIPKTPTALLQAAVMAEHYREMVVLSSPPLPPFGLDRILMPPLARLGRGRGYLPGAIMGPGSSSR